jgi:hypothetical protein
MRRLDRYGSGGGRGSFGFPDLTRILDVADVTPLLEELASAGIFDRVAFDIELTCPRCNSPRELRAKYLCPLCGKYNLKKGSLIQHYPCGYTGFREEFASGEDLTCPKCRKELKLVGTDYRVVDNMFNCRSCKANFTVPNIIHRCYHCNENFRLEELNPKSIWSYRFREELRGEVVANCVADAALVDLYKRAGYAAERLKPLKGVSGLSHVFDIVATKDDENTVIAVASNLAGVDSQSVISIFAKKVDVHPKHAILIAIPSLTADARKLADVYGIEIAEGRDFRHVLTQFQSRLQTEISIVREKESASYSGRRCSRRRSMTRNKAPSALIRYRQMGRALTMKLSSSCRKREEKSKT